MRMRTVRTAALSGSLLLLLSACVTQPMGPMIQAMPGPNKNWDAFRQDDGACQDYAGDVVAGRVKEANDRQARNTVIGTAVGAGVGAAVGNTRGAVAGGVIGALLGSSTANPNGAQYAAQRRYDIAYAQCMQSKGNDVGGPGRPDWRGRDRYRDYPPPPPPPDGPPPPPPRD